MEDRLALRIDETAETLGFSRSKTYELVASGEIPSIRIGKSPARAGGWPEGILAEEDADGRCLSLREPRVRYPGCSIMTATFVLTVSLNEDWLEHLAQHRDRPKADVVRETVALLEGRLADAVRHHDAVLGPVSSATDVDGERFRWHV